ncbi:phage tail protein [Salmonella enterica]|nr:phage tail protein [Salmonella enterica]
MPTKYFALLTGTGAAKLARATALGTQVEITHMAVGDGNGALPTPNPAQTALAHELRRAQLNMLTIDPVNPGQIIAEQVIPEDAGGWWIREIGLFDKDGDMIAVANCAETYKPQLQEGSGRVQVIRVILIVSSTEAVTLKIDPSVVLSTRQYVDDAVIEVRAYVDEKLAAHLADGDPHPLYAKMADISKFIPAGVPLPWPLPTPPAGWFKCNGAPFNKSVFKELAAAYPTGMLPDLRGEFIRGWSDGSIVDLGRGILSKQRATALRTAMLDYYNQDATGSDGIVGLGFRDADSVFTQIGQKFSNPDGSDPDNYPGIFSDNGMMAKVQTAVTNPPKAIYIRPRNVAFNYIVRAA